MRPIQEMFDLAKVGDVAKECESVTFLGEGSLENSNYKQAVEDLTLCLAKRIKALPADSRLQVYRRDPLPPWRGAGSLC